MKKYIPEHYRIIIFSSAQIKLAACGIVHIAVVRFIFIHRNYSQETILSSRFKVTGGIYLQLCVFMNLNLWVTSGASDSCRHN